MDTSMDIPLLYAIAIMLFAAVLVCISIVRSLVKREGYDPNDASLMTCAWWLMLIAGGLCIIGMLLCDAIMFKLIQ